MSKLYSVGELLIDFQSVGTESLKNTKEFVKNAGGAPANVCVQAVKLGREAAYLTKVGDDGFGDFLIETLQTEGVDVTYISKSADYDTSLAFVSFQKNGEREFSFYRRAAADLHFTPKDFENVTFRAGDVLEFGSVALKTDDAKEAHLSLIQRAKRAGALVCFDPNLRFNLWEDGEELRRTVMQFAAYADVIKVGKDELEFLTGKKDCGGVPELFTGGLKILLVTDAGRGAALYLADGARFACEGYRVKTVDTTGAGDSFFGGFIAQLMENGGISEGADYAGMLSFACKCGAYTTTHYGAIAAMGDKQTIDKAVK